MESGQNTPQNLMVHAKTFSCPYLRLSPFIRGVVMSCLRRASDVSVSVYLYAVHIPDHSLRNLQISPPRCSFRDLQGRGGGGAEALCGVAFLFYFFIKADITRTENTFYSHFGGQHGIMHGAACGPGRQLQVTLTSEARRRGRGSFGAGHGSPLLGTLLASPTCLSLASPHGGASPRLTCAELRLGLSRALLSTPLIYPPQLGRPSRACLPIWPL